MTGRLRGGDSYVTLTWEDGTLSGDDAAVTEARDLIDDDLVIGLTPTGPYVKPGLTNPRSAWVTCSAAFEGRIEYTSDVPSDVLDPGGADDHPDTIY